MTNTTVETRINFRTDPETKKAASQVLDMLGLDMTTVLNMFLKQMVRDQALPFTPSIDSAMNTEARRQALAHEGRSFSSVNELRNFYGD